MALHLFFVTHDQEEALALSDKVVVMADGKIQRAGKPEDIYKVPENAFVADFIGESNILMPKWSVTAGFQFTGWSLGARRIFRLATMLRL